MVISYFINLRAGDPIPLGLGGMPAPFFLTENVKKCYNILTSWQTLRALLQGNVSCLPTRKGLKTGSW